MQLDRWYWKWGAANDVRVGRPALQPVWRLAVYAWPLEKTAG